MNYHRWPPSIVKMPASSANQSGDRLLNGVTRCAGRKSGFRGGRGEKYVKLRYRPQVEERYLKRQSFHPN